MAAPDIQYRIDVLNTAGTVLGSITNGYITNVSWVLNDFGGVVFTVPTFDCPSYLLVPQVEVQIWRDRGDGGGMILIQWAVVVRATATPTTTEFQAVGLLWYFSRRYAGPILTNYISNGTFDVNLTGWTATGTTQTQDTSLKHAGAASMKLVSAGGGGDFYSQTTFTVVTGSTGLFLWAGADFFMTTAPLDPAFLGRGIFMTATVGGTVVAGADNLIDGSNNYEPGQWMRILSSALVIPPSVTATIALRLYSPGGQINWDQVVVRTEESTGVDVLPGLTTDVNTLIGNVAAYAQDPTVNKSALRILGPTGTLGVQIYRQYQFFDQAEIWSGIYQPLIAEGICDIDIVWPTSGATRQIQGFVTKGTNRTATITLGTATNVGDFSVDIDGQATSSSVTVKGSGVNVLKMVPPILAQDEQTIDDILGYAFDLTANGGLILETIDTTAVEVTPDGIQAQAVTDLAALKNPVTVPTLTVKEQPGTPIIGVLATGDTVTLAVAFGYVQLSGTWRIVAMTLDPSTETLQVVLNIPTPGPARVAPHVMAAIGENKQKVADINRVTPTRPRALAPDVIFSNPGAVAVAASPGVTPKIDTTISGISVNLKTTGTSSTVVALLKNGTSAGTVTLTSGTAYNHIFFVPPILFAARVDNYAVSITSAGTGAKDLAGILELS